MAKYINVNLALDFCMRRAIIHSMGRPALHGNERRVFLGARVRQDTVESLKEIAATGGSMSMGRAIDMAVEICRKQNTSQQDTAKASLSIDCQP